MKINDKHFSSLTGLRENFDFNEVWSRLDTFIRNASPDKILYNSETLAEDAKYFSMIASPEAYSLKSSETSLGIADKDDNVVTEIKPHESELLAKLDHNEQIQLIALARLCRFDINAKIIDAVSYKVPIDNDTIILDYGQSLKLYDNPYDAELQSKKIIVSRDATKSSVVGNVSLKPGQGTFGVFSGDKLVYVCPLEQSNDAFRLESRLLPDNTIEVNVIDRRDSTICRTYKDCKSFAVLGSNGYLAINHHKIECNNGDDGILQNTINDKISCLDVVLSIEVDLRYRSITITLANNDKKYITY